MRGGVLHGVPGGQLRQPGLGARVGGRLGHPQRVAGVVRPQPDRAVVECRRVVPGVRRFQRVALAQGADPGVHPPAAIREQAPYQPLHADPDLPGDPSARPVAGRGPPEHHLEPQFLEAPGQQQPQGPGGHSVTTRPCSEAVAQVRGAVPVRPQTHRSGEAAPGLDREGQVAALAPLPFAGADELLRVPPPVGQRHRRPALHLQVAALREDVVDVVRAVPAQRHLPVREPRGPRRRVHPVSLPGPDGAGNAGRGSRYRIGVLAIRRHRSKGPGRSHRTRSDQPACSVYDGEGTAVGACPSCPGYGVPVAAGRRSDAGRHREDRREAPACR